MDINNKKLEDEQNQVKQQLKDKIPICLKVQV